ncbi:uncharacterized protein LOC123524838 [Mercenaria mercenaria]|uniref:uncharacterized protein LOC123524838 n=1 Tax=Mercenaria mercenaria TaxID=6596 RepID=UPI00234EEBC3|nr:uncharacterized protein LOC123524838 [Mercenaria mercenaria]XP_053394395.1 uncharacterized protein LOC123524838 [Mercenaria mercenaria]XP_053394396.1 uncharacterized protein LOC123524838 [Mercenaria mercenaria]
MQLSLFFLVCVFLANASGNSVKEKLQIIPAPMPGFNERATLGRWFQQFRMTGCGYSSSDRFTYYEQDLRPFGDALHSFDTWRNGICNTLTTRYLRTGPGVYTVKDPIGAIWSGTAIVAASDYKTFKIVYGCSKISTMGDRCDDPWLQVFTRSPKPGKRTIARIDYVLRGLFDISISELPRIRQVRPCSPIGGGKKLG